MGANPKGSDSFLARKLADLEKHEVPSAQDFTNSWVRRGSVMSRDGDAMGGGFRAAAHQKVLGVAAHGTAVGDALRWLESLARQSAAHLRRIDPKGTSGVQTGGSTIFIGHGHAAAWRELKDFLRDRLEVPVSEYNTVSAAGVATAERLKELLDNAKFAFLIMTGEDEQADGAVRARQNVIQEIGLFQGRLGFGKAIILLEEGCAEFSNMAGLGVIPFPRGQLAAGFEEIRRVLEREGII
jgi:predicted nucleotide-binding protein